MRSLFQKDAGVAARRFSLFSLVGCATNLICLPLSLLLHGTSVGSAVCGLCFVALVVLSFLGRHTKRYAVCLRLMLWLLVLVEFPVLYYMCGMSCLVYLLLGIAGVAVFARKRYRVAKIGCSIAYDAAVILFSHFVSKVPGRLDEGSGLGCVVCSFLVAGCSLAALISLLSAQYEQQARQLSAMSRSLKDAATTDPLTRVYNRRYLTAYLGTLMRDPDAEFTVVLLDIDHFKAVNDTYGHVFGDSTLKHFAAACSHAMEGTGIVARYGGEEFMLVFHGLPQRKIAATLAAIREDFLHFSTLEKGAAFTFSGGSAAYLPGMHVSQLFRIADEKLYRAKNGGRNKVIY